MVELSMKNFLLTLMSVSKAITTLKPKTLVDKLILKFFGLVACCIESNTNV